MDVKLPDGRILRNVPEGTTKAQIAQKLGMELEPKPKQQGNDSGSFAAGVYGFNSAVPFGNRITSALAAGAVAPFVDETFLELYAQAQDDTRATREAHPFADGLGTAAGIVATLPIGLKTISNPLAAKTFSGTGTLSKLGNFGTGIAKNIAVTAPISSLYAAGEASPGNIVQGAKEGLGTGAALGAGIGVLSPVASRAAGLIGKALQGVKARSPEQLTEAAEAIKRTSSRAYQKMRESGAVFTPETNNSIIGKIESSLKDDGPLNASLHGHTLSIVKDLKEAMKRSDFGLEELDQYRRLLGRIPRTVPEDIRKSSIVMDALDDAVNAIEPKDLLKGDTKAIDALNLGRSEYHKYAKFNTIAEIVKKSKGDANYIKRELSKIADSKKKSRGFKEEELNALNEAATLSGGEGVLKLLGKFGFDPGGSKIGSGVGAAVGSLSVGSLVGGPGYIAAPVVGTAARKGQKLVARAKVEDLLEIIENGGTVPEKLIFGLPPKDAERVLNKIKTAAKIQTSAAAGRLLND